jgi:hypothetical protein
MKIFRISQIVFAVCSMGVSTAISGQAAAAVTAQSLAGDWEYVINPPIKLELHLHVDASGALTGTVVTPDTPPRQIELTKIKLVGNMLSYSMPPQPGTVYEVVSADGTKMLGAYLWTKVGAAGATATAAPFEPLAQIAGDWETPGGGASAQVLRLRLDAGGALTGTIDTPEPMALRLQLGNVQVSGRMLGFTMPDGRNTFQGAFSADGKTVTSTGQSTMDANWQHVRTAAQAAAQEAADAAKPSNGDWSGVANYTANFPGLPPSQGTATFLLHFRSNPASCAMRVVGDERNNDLPCQMTSTGNSVHIENVVGYSATFIGTISADGNHLAGAWTMGSVWHWSGPVQIDFKRVAPASH